MLQAVTYIASIIIYIPAPLSTTHTQTAETILKVGVCWPKVLTANIDWNRGRGSMHIFSTGCVCVCMTKMSREGKH